ncbi:toxin [Pseudomonas sp. NPDC089534]|uniref:toxin n=1 Tax=Pseudomonas sp. NPDC089534 TaxID=3364468 RepID=UPI0038227E27
MSNAVSSHPSFEQVKGDLNQIGHHLFQSEAPLFPDTPPSAEQRVLAHLNSVIKRCRQRYLEKARAHYPALSVADVQSPQGRLAFAAQAGTLNRHLLDLDATEAVEGLSLKTFMTYEAGFKALENEARQGVADRLLHPEEGLMLERTGSHPTLRPNLHALTFLYQERRVELAGAFVATQKSPPAAVELTDTQDVGRVLLFTPLRGVESFDSLPALNDWLQKNMNQGSARPEFRALLPVRYQGLTATGIWPLALSPIIEKSLFEHTFDASIDKRTQDIERALSLADNPQQDPARLTAALDRAIGDALPDLDARLALRAQTLLERHLRHSAPDWYRSADETQRAALAEHLARYDTARRHLLDLLGPAATPQALARHQWLERLGEDLEIHDLDPDRLSVTTLRRIPGVGEHAHTRNLTELALAGLQTGDERPGSDFLNRTTLTYGDASLAPSHLPVTPAWLAQQLATLQPRIDYAAAQSELAGRQDLRAATETMIDTRINALAWVAVLRGHLQEGDWQRLQDLRNNSGKHLSAGTLAFHGSQLQDLWILRLTDEAGSVTRLLLCTPDAPQAHQFQAFDSETACQRHLLGWAQSLDGAAATGDMSDYLLSRIALRFRPAMKQVMSSLSLKFHDQEHLRVTFRYAVSHQACLKSMSEHAMAMRTDDCNLHTPAWFRSASLANRRKLLTLAETAEGALRAYSRHPSCETNFPAFADYLHEQARLSLNRLLGRTQNDVDPDTVWLLPPPSLFGRKPAPMSYTRLYRDGYDDGIGFINEKFSRAATFKGPTGIDLSRLNAETVARSVTGAWVGQRYIDKVRAELLDTTLAAYAFRRDAILAITQQQMLGAALECSLQGHLASVDLPWLERCIAGMGDTSASTRHRYAIHRLLLDGDWVKDVFLFSHAGHPTLLYTPDTPDGVRFREARLFNYLLKSQPAVLDYLTRRVDVRSRARIRAFLQNARLQLPQNLDSTSVSPARYDSIHRVSPLLDLRRAVYDMRLQRKIDEVSATTGSRTRMITGILWSCVEWTVAIATAPFPALSLSTGLLLAFKDAMLALHAYNQGDADAALGHLAGYLFNSAGAIATDLRPALRTLKPLGRLSRLAAADTGHRQAMALIQQIDPAPPPSARMQPVFFNGETLWAPLTPDVIGRYLLYRLDPASGRLVSTTRVAAPNADGVWKRTGVVGGAPPYKTVPETPRPLDSYEMPDNQWRDFEPLLAPNLKAQVEQDARRLGLPPTVSWTAAAREMRPMRSAYLLKVKQLTLDAQHFYRQMAPRAPRVPPRPLETPMTFATWLDSDALAGGKHLVIGADPHAIAGKLALIDHLDTLTEKGFKRLYLEYLPSDIFRLKLEKLNKGGSWKHIENHLLALDKAFGLTPHAQHGYLALVRKAREKGMQVKGLDASTSYLLEDVMIMADTPPTAPRDNGTRNFLSHRLIEADTADTPDTRWIALVAPSRLTTFNGKPGLADLQGAVALRIEDVGADLPTGITVDTPGTIAGDALARADFRLALHTPFKTPEPAAIPSSRRTGTLHEFEVPHALRDEIERQSMAPHGLDSRYYPNSTQESRACDTFLELRTDLLKKSDAFFAGYVAPHRPPLPAIAAGITPDGFFKAVSESGLSGLVLGEAHGGESCKGLLIAQMKGLKEKGFRTLYVEHLCSDLHQADLDTFLRTQTMTGRLDDYLQLQNRGHMPDYSGPDTYTEVYQAAGKHGLRIKALDCAASYNLRGVSDKAARYRMFNYLAARVIQADQTAQGAHKWIAFVGNSHANNHRGVPGLAEMLGGIGLNVRDVPAGRGRGIHPGAWEVLSYETGKPALRCDFHLDVAIAGKPMSPPLAGTDRSRLTRKGDFLIEQPSPQETSVVHRSRNGDLISTPVQVDDNGLYYIDRWDKKDLRFPLLHTLIDMLKSEVGLRPVT